MINARVSPYLSMARVDHWIKNLFVIPGLALGISYLNSLDLKADFDGIILKFALSMAGVCLVSSANYTINEWIDREFDKKHPYKNRRPATRMQLSKRIVSFQYVILSVAGLTTGFIASGWIGMFLSFLLAMGLVYNVEPIRSKDIVYLDVITESVNNPIRLAIGWHCAVNVHYVPASAFISYWGAGIFLMALKRYSEMKIIKDRELMASYRKSFAKWSEDSLLIFANSGALISMSFLGVLLTGYRLEYIFLLPLVIALFSKYLSMTLSLNPMAHAPEKIWKESQLQYLIALILFCAVILSFLNLNFLNKLIGFQ